MPEGLKKTWRYSRGLAALVLLWGLFVAVLYRPIEVWLGGAESYDRWLMREWIEESRVWRDTLPDMARDYRKTLDEARAHPSHDFDFQLSLKNEKIRENLKALGTPPKRYAAQLPGFPFIYRVRLTFEQDGGLDPVIIEWDSNVNRRSGQYRELEHEIGPGTHVDVQYQLHAYNTQQRIEQASARKIRRLAFLAATASLVGIVWVFLIRQRERERQRQKLLAQQQLDQAEHRRLEEELRRRDAEAKQEEAERKLLEQHLATKAAEGKALELKTQLYASIGIMAGSYAHNIKNLLVRPNDLLRRCLDADGLSLDQKHMLHEVRQTLGTVTARLHEILRTVRRDPQGSGLAPLELNQLATELHRTWRDLAGEKWKLDLKVELADEPLPIAGDASHLQQAVENLLFNARDATFEMRNHARDEARRQDNLDPPERRHALIAAAAWKGEVTMRTRREGNEAVLEVYDNGIGMSAEVVRRCTETHFSTKRDNAIYEGNTTGMGLGLSFVVVIMEHHRGRLEIESAPLQGATLRLRFPIAGPVADSRSVT
jgi:signal transduction histidine kinase